MKLLILISFLIVFLIFILIISRSFSTVSIQPIKKSSAVFNGTEVPLNIITADSTGNIIKGTTDLGIQYLNVSSIENGETNLNDVYMKNNLIVSLDSVIKGNFVSGTEIIDKNNIVENSQIVNGTQEISGSFANKNGITVTQEVNGNCEVTGSVSTLNFNLLPKGVIIMWTKSTIPDGWALCDGNNGTPNLTNRFVISTGSEYVLGNTGGSETVTIDNSQMPSHAHNGHSHDCVSIILAEQKQDHFAYCKQSYDTTITGGKSDGTTAPHNNMPPYYKLFYIMKT
jgi:microcystin-dependent protein